MTTTCPFSAARACPTVVAAAARAAAAEAAAAAAPAGRGAGGFRYAPETPGGATVDFGEVDLNDIFESFVGGRGGNSCRSAGSASPFGFGGASRRGRNAPQESAPVGGDITYPVTITFEQAVKGTTVEVRLNTPDRSIDETISVKVPPGVEEGSKVRARGKGQPGHGGRGDLIIVTHVEPHPYFKREGKDLLLELPLSAAEAAAGATVSVPTLDGRVELRVPPGIGSGKRLRIKERGVPQRDGSRGDQYVRVLIQLPPGLSDEEKKQLAAIDQAHRFDPRQNVGW